MRRTRTGSWLSALKAVSGTPRRISAGLAVLKLVRAVLGIYVVMLSAQLFGAGVERDAWILSSTLVAILTQLFFGPLNETFRARLVHLREEMGEKEALRSIGAVVALITVMSCFVTALIVFFPGPAGKLIAPGFLASNRPLLSSLMRWTIPLLLLTELTVIWSGVLNAYESYYVPDVLGVISVLITVLGLLFLAPRIGIYSLVVSGYGANIALGGALLWRAGKRGIRFPALAIPEWRLIKPFILFSMPFYLPYALGQISMTVEKMLCTLIGPGTVSILDYGRKFVDIPLGIVTGVASAVFLPIVASHYAKARKEEFRADSARFLRFMLLGISPLIVLLMSCPVEIVRFFLLRGAFSPADVAPTAQILFWFGIGVAAVTVYSLCVQAMIAGKDGAFVSVASACAQILVMAVNLLFYRRWGAATFAASWALIHLVITAVLLVRLFPSKALTQTQLPRLILALIATVIIAGRAATWIGSASETLVLGMRAHALLVLGATGLVSAACMIAFVFLFNIREEKQLIQSRIRWASS